MNKRMPTPMSPERAAKRAREKADMELIGKIADRFDAMIKKFAAEGEDLNPADWERTNTVIMMIQVNNVNKLNLQKLLDFDEANFGHDMFGIARHAKAPTGKFQDCFWPRCGRAPA